MSRDFDIIVTLPLANAGPLLDGDVLPVFYPDPQALGGGELRLLGGSTIERRRRRDRDVFGRGSARDPAGGAHDAPQTP